jgi:hypothetical protein
MTGRAAGFCAGYNVPGFANPVGGRGFGTGMGRGFGRGRGGRGRRNMFYATGLAGWQRAGMGWGGTSGYPAAPSREEELEALKAQAASMETAAQGIRDRITELETGAE